MDMNTINAIKADIQALQMKLDEIVSRNTPKSSVMPEHDMDIALTMYADHLIADYNKWTSRIRVDREIRFERGRKFIKVVSVEDTQRSVHSFICIKAHDKWKVGDILKAATWAQPAKNFARGNVLNPQSYMTIAWTGA